AEGEIGRYAQAPPDRRLHPAQDHLRMNAPWIFGDVFRRRGMTFAFLAMPEITRKERTATSPGLPPKLALITATSASILVASVRGCHGREGLHNRGSPADR